MAQGGWYHSMACPVIFLPIPRHLASPLPLLAPSAAQTVQGLEGPGWNPAHRLTGGLLSWTFYCPTDTFLLGFFFWYSVSQYSFFFPVLAKRGTVSCQLTDSSCPLAEAAGDTGSLTDEV